jgi:hypothetical protein
MGPLMGLPLQYLLIVAGELGSPVVTAEYLNYGWRVNADLENSLAIRRHIRNYNPAGPDDVERFWTAVINDIQSWNEEL